MISLSSDLKKQLARRIIVLCPWVKASCLPYWLSYDDSNMDAMHETFNRRSRRFRFQSFMGWDSIFIAASFQLAPTTFGAQFALPVRGRARVDCLER